VTGCTFESNRAEKRGGGMGSAGHAIVTVTGCIFARNEAGQGGAMSNEDEATPTVTNCVFDANVAGADGGAIYNYYSAPRIANCTFTQNEAQGGGAVSNDEATPRLANCILWDDKPNEIDNGEKAAAPEAKRGAIITYSDVMGGYAGDANIDADPLFADPETGDYRITAQSPCVNKGVAAEAPETDIRGIERPQGAQPDMGAYEYNADDPDRPAGDRPGCFGGSITPPSGPSDSFRGTLVLMAVAAAILFLGGRRASRHHTAIH
jgi:predicted outer membrane repeat protein